MINICNFEYHIPYFSLFCNNISLPNTGICLLSGGNGSGKTTFLRCMAGLCMDFKGEIFINNNSISQFSRQKFSEQISFLPQSSTYPNIIAQEYISQGLYLKGNSQLDMLINNLKADSLLTKNCQNLSGGEKQILRIIRNLALSKKIILLDEPETYLSKEKKELLKNLIVSLSKTSLILISSHSDSLFQTDKILYFNELEENNYQIVLT